MTAVLWCCRVLLLLALLLEVVAEAAPSCLGRPPGYYADNASDCSRYQGTCYVCSPPRYLLCSSPTTRGIVFSCPPGTRFRQSARVCDHAARVACGQGGEEEARRLKQKMFEKLTTAIASNDIQNEKRTEKGGGEKGQTEGLKILERSSSNEKSNSYNAIRSEKGKKKEESRRVCQWHDVREQKEYKEGARSQVPVPPSDDCYCAAFKAWGAECRRVLMRSRRRLGQHRLEWLLLYKFRRSTDWTGLYWLVVFEGNGYIY